MSTFEFGNDQLTIAAVPPGEADAEQVRPGMTHYHLGMDTDCLPAGTVIPKADPWIHFGDGKNEIEMQLKPGRTGSPCRRETTCTARSRDCAKSSQSRSSSSQPELATSDGGTETLRRSCFLRMFLRLCGLLGTAAVLLEPLLRHDRALIAGGLIIVTLLCWAWIVPMALDMYGPMTGPSAWMMTTSGTRPLLWLWAMWAVMMAGMMLPSATPFLLLYGEALRRRPEIERGGRQYMPWRVAIS